MFNDLWEGYFPEELHIGYVTNGVHFPTWVAKSWFDLYKREFGEDFINNQSNPSYWENIKNVPGKEIWDIRQNLRKILFNTVRKHILDNLQNRQDNPSMILETVEAMNDKALTIGFARRFATYKRANLMFKNLKKLSEIVNNKSRPVQFLFAGKAHPNDNAGQELIKYIIEISRKPEFLGKIIFIENYDINIAKKLVQGVDIWLNTPTRPQEASGTSGEKAIMNGVVNFSVLDGWWAEGHFPGAGWALKEERTYSNQTLQDELDSETIYYLLEHEIIPAFYEIDDEGFSPKWISHIKNTIAGIAPKYTMKRMLDEYFSKYYNNLFEHRQKTRENNYENARKIASWKKKIQRGWSSIEIVSLTSPDSSAKPLLLGETFSTEIILNLHELSYNDIGVEIVFGQKVLDEVKTPLFIEPMVFAGMDNNNAIFRCEVNVNKPGVYDYSFRIFPKNILLAHRQDFPLVKWV
jgi:glucan phosphorylase